jgi:hypothetical protein
MPLRTTLFQQFPWVGGLNTSIDESLIPPNQLTVADNVIFDTRGSRKKRDGVRFNWDTGTNSSHTIIGLHDYWFGATTRVQKLVGVSSNGTIYSYTGGTRSTLTDSGTAYSGTLTTCSVITFNNKAIIAVDGGSNVLKYWDGSGNIQDLPGTPPKASILREHIGRIWCNDKENPDRLHYSPVADHTKWLGAGDSGAIDIGVGDGDPEGITAIFPSFKGDLFVAKRTKLYRITGYAPELMQIQLISSGVGCVSHNSIAQIDQDDCMWVSDKGVHSLAATANYGDFTSNYVSIDIQKTFNDDFDRSRLKYCWGAYLPTINSVAFTFTEESGLNRVNTTNTINNAVYLYNIPLKAWYRWPDVSCQSLVVANDSDKKRFYFGTHTTRVSKSFNGTNYDIDSAGTHTAIRFRIVTGLIFPDSNPYTIKGLKRFVIYYKPRGSHTVSVNVKVDNLSLDPANSLNFSETSSSDLLGSTFILGTSILGYDVSLGPYTRHIDGFGRGCKITIEQNGIDEEVEIQGFALEFEAAGTNSEVVLR